MTTAEIPVEAPIVVAVENVTKRFVVRKDNSLKELSLIHI